MLYEEMWKWTILECKDLNQGCPEPKFPNEEIKVPILIKLSFLMRTKNLLNMQIYENVLSILSAIVFL